MSPLNALDNEKESSTMDTERGLTVRWIIVVLSIFKTRFFLTTMATQWLLKFIIMLLRYLGKYSPKLIEIADHLSQSLYQCKQSLESITQI